MSETVQTLRSSFYISIKTAFAAVPPWLWLIQIMLTTFFSMAFFVLIAANTSNPEEAVSYVAIGNAVQSIAMVSMYSISMIPGTQKHMGTMQTLMQTPSRMYIIFVGMALFSILSGFFSVGVSFIYAWGFGVDFSMINAMTLIVVMLVTAFSMSCVGMAIGSVGIYLRTSMILANIMAYIGLVISGVNFPVDQLPGWVQYISYVYPLTYAVEATRDTFNGAGIMDVSYELGIMIIMGLIFLTASVILFRYFEKATRRTGKLDSF